MLRFEDDVYNDWTQGVDDIAKVNLEKPLLLRDPSTLLISVNFDPKLVALLREVKYLDQREETDHVIPESASKVFEQHETYRKFLQVRKDGYLQLSIPGPYDIICCMYSAHSKIYSTSQKSLHSCRTCAIV